jgi:hypothetical protein
MGLSWPVPSAAAAAANETGYLTRQPFRLLNSHDLFPFFSSFLYYLLFFSHWFVCLFVFITG